MIKGERNAVTIYVFFLVASQNLPCPMESAANAATRSNQTKMTVLPNMLDRDEAACKREKIAIREKSSGRLELPMLMMNSVQRILQVLYPPFPNTFEGNTMEPLMTNGPRK